MSISPVAAAVTTLPTSPATAPVAAGENLIIWGIVAWGIIGLLIAGVCGVFRRRSIVGPDRLLPGERAWDLVIVLCVSIFLGLLAASSLSHLQMDDQAKLLLQNAVASAGTFAAIVALLAAMRPGQLRALGTNLKWLRAGIAGGAATLFVLYPLISLTSAAVESIYYRLHRSQPEAHELLQLLNQSHNRGLSLFTIILAVLIAPMSEELAYRGLLQTALGRGFALLSVIWQRAGARAPIDPVDIAITTPSVLDYGSRSMLGRQVASPGEFSRWSAVIVTAAIFAAIHLNIAFFVPLFVLAIGLGYVYERTGNLWVSICAHGLFNGGQILYFLAVTR